jgi:geranylgeranylglycerol-phosphate geranylgeranyltransferase
VTAETRTAPARVAVRAHWETWRPYTTCYPALLGIAGAVVAGSTTDGSPTTASLVVAALAPVLGWLAGHYLGDWFDRDLDAIAKPHRPIPSGRLPARAALIGGLGCAAASLALIVAINPRIVPVFALAMAGIVAYSRLLKQRGASGNLVRGALSALAIVVGGMTVTPWPTWALLPAALGFLLHDSASNLVGTVRDVDGDRAGGYRSVPVQHGVATAVRLAGALWAAGLTAIVVGALLSPRPTGQLLLLTVAALIGGYTFGCLRDATADDRERALGAHELLVAERLVLAGAVVAGAAGVGPALLVLLPALAFSVITQARMRARHEFPDGKDGS